MRKFLFIYLLFIGNAVGQFNLTESLYHSYPGFKEKTFQGRIVKHSEVKSLVEQLKTGELFRVKELGQSLEGREIYLVSIGKGPVNVLAWSQMHGDEPTATMALFDIFNFFMKESEYKELKNHILSKLTLHFIPMLNPDGAEKFTRRNVLSIDLNRDAGRVEFPEAQILKSVRDSIKPEFGFNLHDQNPRYSAGNSHRTATISFLAPAFNYEKEINDVRKNTMAVIVRLSEELGKVIPGHIARYNDDFEPRAFGDNFVKWGTSSILIESGGWVNDPEKQFIRKLNFIALINAFKIIADEEFKCVDYHKYFNIPENDKLIFNILLRNLNITFNGKKYLIDIGVNREEKAEPGTNRIFYYGTIDDIGDLSIFYGNEEINCEGMDIFPGKVYPEIFQTVDDLKKINFTDLLTGGFTTVKVENIELNSRFTKIPFNIVSSGKNIDQSIVVDNKANFYVTENGKVRFVIVNGFLFDVETQKGKISNGLVFR